MGTSKNLKKMSLRGPTYGLVEKQFPSITHKWRLLRFARNDDNVFRGALMLCRVKKIYSTNIFLASIRQRA